MMIFDIVTLFPALFDAFAQESIVARAQEKRRIRLRTHNPRDFALDRHRTVDDRPYGGGAGMLMKIDPLVRTLKKIKRLKRSRIILLSPSGTQFTQKKAVRLSRTYDQLIVICGRYEGIDARMKHYIDEELSIGPYVLNGGEVAAMAVVESVCRLLQGVLGNAVSLKDETWTGGATKEYPQYTRPEVFDGHRVPAVLLTGDHTRIALWRAKRGRTLSPKGV